MDETGFDATLMREYAYARAGKRVLGERTGDRFGRTRLIAGLRESQPVAPMEFKGYCNTEVVFTWVKEMLVPSLTPGDVVIWDNTTFHKSPRLGDVIEEEGCHL